jgi:hypothetical protein
MNPNIQAQLYDVTTGKFVQADGGELSTIAILFQILVEQRIQTQYLQAMASGQTPTDDPASLRADALLDRNFVIFR